MAILPTTPVPTRRPTGRVTTRVAVRLGGDGRSMAGRLMDNLLKDYAGTHYTWDERGNLIERTWNGEKNVFTWDGFNRMRSASTYGKTTTFSYDALGRRIAKRSSYATTLFGWDGDTLAFESTQSTEGQQEQQAWRGDSVHYIHEPGSFVPLVQIRQAQAVALSQTTDVKALIAANGGRYDIEQDPLWNGQQLRTPQAFAREEIAFYQCDHLGTPQELTDHEGRIAWSASYKAWGEAKQAISEAGRKAGFRNPIRFQGQYWDAETGLHYNRHRYYDPQSGRFVGADPIGLLGGPNLHAYASNPTEWIDPLGLQVRPGGACNLDSGKHGELSPDTNRAPGNRNTRADKFVQSHHPVQNEWPEQNIPGYDRNQAPAVLLRSASGESHAQISAAQRAQRRGLDSQPGGRWGTTTVRDEFNTGYRQMINAGVPTDVARRAMKKSYKYFDCLGAFK
ncbi:RHS family protein [Variovorax paradoxus B4]|uniref:RHS family protein n=1 Tax=Variovorax paradoxus B4 TaxID=1246301 RepID=T1XJN3_VARPD|nr:RHS repeat-associated core domain-containing protein [Variovorax paradoxus]AGU52771.1 RHS family protein [Variovorax paradoxus B4]